MDTNKRTAIDDCNVVALKSTIKPKTQIQFKFKLNEFIFIANRRTAALGQTVYHNNAS